MSDTTPPPPATRDQIVWHFLSIHALHGLQHLTSVNWGTDPGRPSVWEIQGTDTYINGILLTIDLDYYMGYLLVLVDRDTSAVSYLVVTCFHGPRTEDGELIRWDHDSEMMAEDVGTFFDRKITGEQACTWAVGKIYGLVEAYSDRQR